MLSQVNSVKFKFAPGLYQDTWANVQQHLNTAIGTYTCDEYGDLIIANATSHLSLIRSLLRAIEQCCGAKGTYITAGDILLCRKLGPKTLLISTNVQSKTAEFGAHTLGEFVKGSVIPNVSTKVKVIDVTEMYDSFWYDKTHDRENWKTSSKTILRVACYIDSIFSAFASNVLAGACGYVNKTPAIRINRYLLDVLSWLGFLYLVSVCPYYADKYNLNDYSIVNENGAVVYAKIKDLFGHMAVCDRNLIIVNDYVSKSPVVKKPVGLANSSLIWVYKVLSKNDPKQLDTYLNNINVEQIDWEFSSFAFRFSWGTSNHSTNCLVDYYAEEVIFFNPGDLNSNNILKSFKDIGMQGRKVKGITFEKGIILPLIVWYENNGPWTPRYERVHDCCTYLELRTNATKFYI